MTGLTARTRREVIVAVLAPGFSIRSGTALAQRVYEAPRRSLALTIRAHTPRWLTNFVVAWCLPFRIFGRYDHCENSGAFPVPAPAEQSCYSVRHWSWAGRLPMGGMHKITRKAEMARLHAASRDDCPPTISAASRGRGPATQWVQRIGVGRQRSNAHAEWTA
jgi:hypothetical protein